MKFKTDGQFYRVFPNGEVRTHLYSSNLRCHAACVPRLKETSRLGRVSTGGSQQHGCFVIAAVAELSTWLTTNVRNPTIRAVCCLSSLPRPACAQRKKRYKV